MIYITKDTKKDMEDRITLFEETCEKPSTTPTDCLIMHYLVEELQKILKAAVVIEDNAFEIH